MNIFQQKGYLLIENEEYYGGTAVVRKYKKGRIYYAIKEIKDDMDHLKKEVDANELDRIKYEILQFSGSLRNGLKRTEVDYQHIEALFTKYRNKGGNTYIMHEMTYIRECHDKGMIL